MPRFSGNELFQLDIEREMTVEGTNQAQATQDLIHKAIKRLRATNWRHEDIATALCQHWGLSRSSYYRFLKRIRKEHFLV